MFLFVHRTKYTSRSNNSNKKKKQREEEFKNTLLKILTEMFACKKKLLKHIFESSSKIILKSNNLILLTQIITGTNNVKLMLEQIFKCYSTEDSLMILFTVILNDDIEFFITHDELYNKIV